MKKSQLQSQIFIYILTIVLVSLILIYGYNAITNFRDSAESVTCIKLRNDLRNSIDSLTGDFGTVRKKQLALCKEFNQVCFVETFESFDASSPVTNLAVPLEPIMINSISSRTGRNVFLIKRGAVESLYVGNISVAGDVLCVQGRNAEINLRLEGKGNHVIVSEWS